MRLTCPNCSAQYEVAEDMIPADGRDVQCSNCATTWFQEGRQRTISETPAREVRRPGRRPEPAAVAEEETPDADAPDEEIAETPPEPPVAVEDGPPEEPQPAPMAKPVGAAPRRPLADEETLEILRQERAHEARKRAAERRRRATPPPDPDMLTAPDMDDAEEGPEEERDAEADAQRAAAAAERARMAAAASVARSRELADRAEPAAAPARSPAPPPAPAQTEPADDDVANAIASALREVSDPIGELDDDAPELAGLSAEEKAAVRRQSRRDLLPDIEEINSSLRPDERALEAERSAADEEMASEGGRLSGFRIGFFSIVAVVAVGVLAYIFASQIGAAVPGLAEPLAAWSAWVDAQRIALEENVNAVTSSILPSQ